MFKVPRLSINMFPVLLSNQREVVFFSKLWSQCILSVLQCYQFPSHILALGFLNIAVKSCLIWVQKQKGILAAKLGCVPCTPREWVQRKLFHRSSLLRSVTGTTHLFPQIKQWHNWRASSVTDAGQGNKGGTEQNGEHWSSPWKAPCMQLTSAWCDAWSTVATEPDVLGSKASKERSMFS